jgi:hypothetical protein
VTIYHKITDPKYLIATTGEHAQIVNAATKVPIPDDEPIFIIRGKDANAVSTLLRYSSACGNHEHICAVLNRIEAFCKFNIENPERMKEPDTDMSIFE